MSSRFILFFLLALIFPVQKTHADSGGRLPATGGVVNVEGSGGGGLNTWALITGYGTQDEWGGAVNVTHVPLTDFSLNVAAVTLGWHDWLEVSAAQEKFDLGQAIPGHSLSQDIFGVKVKLAGDAVFAPNTWLPQIALGALYKSNHDFDFIQTLGLGVEKSSDTEFYLAASKLYFAGLFGRNVLANMTLRYTRANQFGLLGFGGPLEHGRTLNAEASLGMFLNDQFLLGMEYRQKPDNLVLKENSAKDLFLAWMPNRRVAVTLAYVALSNIAIKDHQEGAYLSVQANY